LRKSLDMIESLVQTDADYVCAFLRTVAGIPRLTLDLKIKQLNIRKHPIQ